MPIEEKEKQELRMMDIALFVANRHPELLEEFAKDKAEHPELYLSE